MAFQTPITIIEALKNIEGRKWALPAIQRELVWSQRQIARLFDSLMRGYPVGSFLFWRVEPDAVKQYQFYEFARDYHQKERPHCVRFDVVNPDAGLTAILDGQQRLTAMNIALVGSHATKLPRLWWNNPRAFPIRHLYLNLLAYASENEQGMEYDFRFLDERQSKQRIDSHFWYRVADIRSVNDLADIFLGSTSQDLPQSRLAYGMLAKLHQVVHQEPVISYYEENEQDLDKVLDIFIRTNSGGTILSYSDLLMSIATAMWDDLDAREEIHNRVDELNEIGDGFNFNKDFVLKAGLVLGDINSVEFKVTNFNRDNMLLLQAQWQEMGSALRYAIELIASFGYSWATLRANNAVLPIAYYIFKRKLGHDIVNSVHRQADRGVIRHWFTRSLLKRGIWGSGVDSLLVALRTAIRDQEGYEFPQRELEMVLRSRGRTLAFDNEELEAMVDNPRDAFPLLSLLYPNSQFAQTRYHIDHVFPKSRFTSARLRRAGVDSDDVQTFLDRVNCLPNLQLLNETENQEKSDLMPLEWLEGFYPDLDARPRKVDLHDLGELPRHMTGFNQWYEARRERMLARLRDILGVDPTNASSDGDSL